MEYSLLGPTGVKVSKICLGTATFGVAPDAQEAGRPGGLLKALNKTVIETALEEEMAKHLGYDKHDALGRNRGIDRLW